MKESKPIIDCELAVSEIRKSIPKRRLLLQEHFIVLALDIRLHLIGKPILASLGTVSSVEVHMRDIFRDVIKRNAVGIIVAHNHPSGTLSASIPDREIAGKIDECGKILGINVYDHIIITKDKFSSRREGMWK